MVEAPQAREQPVSWGELIDNGTLRIWEEPAGAQASGWGWECLAVIPQRCPHDVVSVCHEWTRVPSRGQAEADGRRHRDTVCHALRCLCGALPSLVPSTPEGN